LPMPLRQESQFLIKCYLVKFGLSKIFSLECQWSNMRNFDLVCTWSVNLTGIQSVLRRNRYVPPSTGSRVIRRIYAEPSVRAGQEKQCWAMFLLCNVLKQLL
jgi:hypothetical protein